MAEFNSDQMSDFFLHLREPHEIIKLRYKHYTTECVEQETDDENLNKESKTIKQNVQ